MSSLFIVTTTIETPRLYVSQQPYHEVLRALRAWPYSHTRTNFVFEPRLLPNVHANEHGDPSGCGQLALVGRVDPQDEAESWRYQLGGAIEKLPQEQALLELQRAVDYLDKLRVRIEQKFVEPEAVK